MIRSSHYCLSLDGGRGEMLRVCGKSLYSNVCTVCTELHMYCTYVVVRLIGGNCGMYVVVLT